MKGQNKSPVQRASLRLQSSLAFLSYSLISIIFTYPMVFRLNAFPYTGAEPIPPGSDIFIYLWNMWWFKDAIINFTNPFWTDYIFHPQGVSLLFTLASIIWCLMAMPLQSFLSLIAIYNLFFIFSLILSAMGAFWLIRYLTKSPWGSFIGGTVFAFAPYHFVHIGHMTVFSVQWLPFFILFFLKTFNEKRRRDAIFAALFLAANWYSDLNYATFTTVFIVLFLLYQLKYNRQGLLSRAYSKRLLEMFCTFFIIAGPYAIAMLGSMLSGGADISIPLHSSVSQSADLLSFFVPSFMHPIFGQAVRPFYEHITTYNGLMLGGYIEVTAYVGFTTIFLVIFALRRLGFLRLRLWIFIAAFFFVLTLGPVLKVGGLIQVPAEWMHLDKIAQRIEPELDPLALDMMKKYAGIPLPYLIWHFIPILSGSESAGRLNIMFVLAWSVLCGFGVSCLTEKLRKRETAAKAGCHAVCLSLVFLILFEYAPFPIRMTECHVPPFYKKLQDEEDAYAVIDLPILNSELDTNLRTSSNVQLFGGFNNTSSKRSVYNQTVHHKKIVNGFTVRLYENIRDFIDNTDVVRLLSFPEQIDNIASVDLTALEKHNIKYIILHPEYLTEKEFKKLTLFLENKFERAYDNGEIVAYQTYR